MRRHAQRIPAQRIRPLRVVVAVATLLAVLVTGALWSKGDRLHEDAGSTHPRSVRPTDAPDASVQRPTTPRPDADVEEDLARLRALTVPARVADSAEHRIPDGYRHQPDLYARAFVEQLLKQDYATPRDAHLAWVQSESARTDEPLVTGLVPRELRDRLALFSVTDDRSGPAPVPSAAEWDRLRHQHAHTTVKVQRVTEPLVGSNAVEAGRVTDPGVTAREVTATVTVHADTDGQAADTAASVALTLNLTGPPTRDTWAFVAVITYRAMPMGAS
jgi:hypothetical protein